MLHTIFLKTLYERRWALVWWSLSGVALIMLIALIFPVLRDSFAVSLEGVPESLQALVGSANSYATLSGFIKLQVFDQMVFLPIVLGILLGGALLAGQEGKGTLQSLATLPVKRSSIYIQKFTALKLILLAVSSTLFLGSLIGAAVIGESLPIVSTLLATLMAFVLAIFFAVLTFALGAITGRRGLAGASAGLFAFATFLITSLAAGVQQLKWLDYFSPFHYYTSTNPLDSTFSLPNMLILIIASTALFFIGLAIFARRDIYQR